MIILKCFKNTLRFFKALRIFTLVVLQSDYRFSELTVRLLCFLPPSQGPNEIRFSVVSSKTFTSGSRRMRLYPGSLDLKSFSGTTKNTPTPNSFIYKNWTSNFPRNRSWRLDHLGRRLVAIRLMRVKRNTFRSLTIYQPRLSTFLLRTPGPNFLSRPLESSSVGRGHRHVPPLGSSTRAGSRLRRFSDTQWTY